MKTKTGVILTILAVGAGVGLALMLTPSKPTTHIPAINKPEVSSEPQIVIPGVPTPERQVEAISPNADASDMAAVFTRAEDGDANAQLAVGVAYLDGVGIGQDRDVGLEWLRQAQANGNETAGHILRELGETAQ